MQDGGGELSKKTWVLFSKKGGGKLGRQEQQTPAIPSLLGISSTSFTTQLKGHIL